MGLLKLKKCYSVYEYLAIERKAKDRHQYFDGEMVAMAGESWEHAVISGNAARLIGNHLENKPCQAVSKDTKVRSGPSLRHGSHAAGMFSYPDVLVVCDEPEFFDDESDVVLNPKVIVEVLSPSTEHYDRGEKFLRYRNYNPTLKDYLLVAQDKVLVEHFTRQSNGEWKFKSYEAMSETVVIRSIKCSIKVKDIYARVKFKPEKKPKPGSVAGEGGID